MKAVTQYKEKCHNCQKMDGRIPPASNFFTVHSSAFPKPLKKTKKN